MGGVSWRNDCFGRRPLLAGNGERSPPPPPPIAFGFTGATSGGARSIGAIRGTYSFTLSCTAFDDATVNKNTANRTWPPADIMKDFFWRPYRPQMSFTGTGFDVRTSGGSLGGLMSSLTF